MCVCVKATIKNFYIALGRNNKNQPILNVY